jgi:hypothetical protein
MRNYKGYCELPTQGDLLQKQEDEKKRIDDEPTRLPLPLLRRKPQRFAKSFD